MGAFCAINVAQAGNQEGDSTMTNSTQEAQFTIQGKPIVLMGPSLKPGDTASDFRVVDAGFKQVKLSDFKGKVVLINVVQSLDTGVCSLQTKRFNEEAAKLPANVVIITISMDLPFAQKRFCEAEKVDRIKVLSDFVWREFGVKYGIIIKDLGLLARSIWIIKPDGTIGYREQVKELSTHPDYDTALKTARGIAAGK
ncbi:MAG: thiol peroxidase [Verrucomicrobia bacterium]|nr:thiol peroxidase [Verrucomicrobiota bacterium]